MNNLNKYLILTILIFSLTQCTKEPFEPVDIFEEEIVTVDSLGNFVDDGTHVMLPVTQICNGLELIANKERVLDLPGGFQLKGTLWDTIIALIFWLAIKLTASSELDVSNAS